MASYGNLILMLQRQYPQTFIWRHYDTVFRRYKAVYKNKLKWHILYPQALEKAKYRDTMAAAYYKNKAARGGNSSNGRGRRPTPSASATNASQFQGTGTCRHYNRGAVCKFTPCKFFHACSKCKGNHPATQCSQLSAQAPGQSTSS